MLDVDLDVSHTFSKMKTSLYPFFVWRNIQIDTLSISWYISEAGHNMAVSFLSNLILLSFLTLLEFSTHETKMPSERRAGYLFFGQSRGC
jgi:hypothetical protein